MVSLIFLAGRGAPVVPLHGGLLDQRMWDDQFSFFAQHYEVIRYDMRSCGQSETTPSSEPYTHHDDLYAFLRWLQIPHVSLVGLSNYAIVLDFAIAYPKLVQKLALVSPGLRGHEFRDPRVGTHFAAVLRALEQQDLNGAVEVFLTVWVAVNQQPVPRCSDFPFRWPADAMSRVRQVRNPKTNPAVRLRPPSFPGLSSVTIGRPLLHAGRIRCADSGSRPERSPCQPLARRPSF
jgi:3-oxoadipate enol-lactonase